MAKITIDSVKRLGDQVTCQGTVDAIQVSCSVWASHLSTLADDTARRAYLMAQLVAALPAHPLTLDALVMTQAADADLSVDAAGKTSIIPGSVKLSKEFVPIDPVKL